MANKFLISWEKARGLLKPLDPESVLPWSSALVFAAMWPNTGSREGDRTQITQYDYALALDGPMNACPMLAPGVVGAVAAPLAISLPTQPRSLGADGLPPLYIARTDIVPANLGMTLVGAVNVAVSQVQVTILSPPFLGTIPPGPTLVPLVLAAWQGAGFSGVGNPGQGSLLDAAMVRYITAAFSGGEGSASDPPVLGLPSLNLNPKLDVIIDDMGKREVTFTNSSEEPSLDPGLAWVIKTGVTLDPTEVSVEIGGPSSTLAYTYPAVPSSPTVFTASLVGGNMAGTVESPSRAISFI